MLFGESFKLKILIKNSNWNTTLHYSAIYWYKTYKTILQIIIAINKWFNIEIIIAVNILISYGQSLNICKLWIEHLRFPVEYINESKTITISPEQVKNNCHHNQHCPFWQNNSASSFFGRPNNTQHCAFTFWNIYVFHTNKRKYNTKNIPYV